MKDHHNPVHKPDRDRFLGRCKVCAKQIRTGEDHANVFHAGNYYLVCCASCAAKFEAQPGQYLVGNCDGAAFVEEAQ